MDINILFLLLLIIGIPLGYLKYFIVAEVRRKFSLVIFLLLLISYLLFLALLFYLLSEHFVSLTPVILLYALAHFAIVWHFRRELKADLHLLAERFKT